MKRLIAQFVGDETGATAIEYGLIAAIVSVGIIAALQGLRTNLQTTFNTIGTAVNTAGTTGG